MPAQPASATTRRSALVNRTRMTVIVLILALPLALRVARKVDLRTLRLALVDVNLRLGLQAENRVAEADVVPVCGAAFRLPRARATGNEQAENGERASQPIRRGGRRLPICLRASPARKRPCRS